MTIEIHQPEIEALIQQRLQTGAFHDVEDVLLHALRTSKPPAARPAASDAKNLVELFEPVRGLLTDEEIDVMFSRNPSAGRPVDLE
ncbi:MAG TPA: hypothetical protein VMF91_07400 [Bryobacteraceae bacterium]|nr:hypothetical protein [Bryobacteraceae bacterium]